MSDKWLPLSLSRKSVPRPCSHFRAAGDSRLQSEHPALKACVEDAQPPGTLCVLFVYCVCYSRSCLIYIYIYIHRERERDTSNNNHNNNNNNGANLLVCLCSAPFPTRPMPKAMTWRIHIYIYIYIYGAVVLFQFGTSITLRGGGAELLSDTPCKQRGGEKAENRVVKHTN